MTVVYADLEEKATPAFLPGPGLVPVHQAGTPGAAAQVQQAPGQGQAQAAMAQATLGAQTPGQRFPMGVVGL